MIKLYGLGMKPIRYYYNQKSIYWKQSRIDIENATCKRWDLPPNLFALTKVDIRIKLHVAILS